MDGALVYAVLVMLGVEAVLAGLTVSLGKKGIRGAACATGGVFFAVLGVTLQLQKVVAPDWIHTAATLSPWSYALGGGLIAVGMVVGFIRMMREDKEAALDQVNR